MTTLWLSLVFAAFLNLYNVSLANLIDDDLSEFTQQTTSEGPMFTVGDDGDFKTLEMALKAKTRKIRILVGVHEIASTIHISHSVDISGISRSKSILRLADCNDNIDSLISVEGSSYVKISHLTLDGRISNFENGNECGRDINIFLCRKCSNTKLSYLLIYGSKQGHSIRFYGESKEETFSLDNVVEHNIIYGGQSGNGILMESQKNALVSNNRIIDGGISFLSASHSSCVGNIVVDSENFGIVLTFPATNVIIEENKVMRSKGSSIFVIKDKTLVDAAKPGRINDFISDEIIIRRNHINDSRNSAIEVTGVNGIIIEQNVISLIDYCGIYLEASSRCTVSNNFIERFRYHEERGAIYNSQHAHGIHIHRDSSIKLFEHNTINIKKENHISEGVYFGNKQEKPKKMTTNTFYNFF